MKNQVSRIESIDIIRGIVMVLMSIDHVRVYSGVPAGGFTLGVFFTRWVTHFCAPAFIFLAGTSAYLYCRKHGEVTKFLVSRGVWLIFLELTVMRLAWTFNFDVSHMMAGVIWVIGWCMILLAVLSRLPLWMVGVVGFAIVAGHNLMDAQFLAPAFAQSDSWLWKILYRGPFGGPIALGSEASLIVLYSIVPWIGVMALGYAFGKVLTLGEKSRNRLCLTIGLGAIALFCLLRGLNLYGDPRPWGGGEDTGFVDGLLDFLWTRKYPASFLFLLMTLGPTIVAIPLLARFQCRPLAVLGRVPFFYYLLHIPLIHALALVVSWIRGGEVDPWLFTNHPMGNPDPPEGYMWSLVWLYAIVLLANALLYPLCKWFSDLKARTKNQWLSYL